MLPITISIADSFAGNKIGMNCKCYLFSKVLLLVFSASILSSKCMAQDSTKNLTLHEAIEAALANNRDIHLAAMDEHIAAANYKQTEAVFLPQVDFSLTGMGTNDPLNAFGYKLEQRSINQNDFAPSMLNHPTGTGDLMTKIEVQQPILNMDMLYQRKAAGIEAEVYHYKTQRTIEYLTFEVQKAYLQLQLANNAVQVLEDALVTTNSVYAYTKNHFEQGLIQKSDLLNARVQLNKVETNLNKAKGDVRNASDFLSLLMGARVGAIYKINPVFEPSGQVTDSSQTIGSNRADFIAMQKAIDASDLMIKSSRMSYLPKLNAFGNYQYNDSRLAVFGANSYLVGVQLSWSVFKGNKTKNVITVQKLERDKLSEQLTQQKEQSQLEINKAMRDLADADFEMKQDKAAIEQAAESFRILQNRYQQGLVSTTDVLTAQTQLLQQKFALTQAAFNMNLTRFYLQFLTATTNK